MKKTIELSIILISVDMFNATGESDKPAVILKLTEQQQELINKQYLKGYNILSIHPIVTE